MPPATPSHQNQQPAPAFDLLDQVIAGFTEVDLFTIRDACQGVQIFGETGSGKTTGSGRHFALAYLRAGFGGLVLTAKPEDLDTWREYTKEAGRAADLIFFGPEHAHGFNFLRHESECGLTSDALTRNLVDMFLTLAEINDGEGQKSGGTNEAFWQRELRKLLSNSIDLLRFAGEPATLENIYDVVLSAPITEADFDDAGFQAASFCYKSGDIVKTKLEAGQFNNRDSRDAYMTLKYWRTEFARLDPRPRGSIVSSFTGMADAFLRGRSRELFCDSTTLRPEDSFDGKIIVLDMPVKIWKSLGIYGQMVFKYCWQKAVERRSIQPMSRPVFLWADESQYFANSHDVLFQTTARSSRVSTVYLTQNLSGYIRWMTGGEAAAHALLGNLATKVFHSNTCAITNQYASNLFAKDWAKKQSHNINFSEHKASYGQNEHEELRDTILPREFSGLASGGPLNNFLVEAIVNHAGRRFNLTQTNAVRVLFNQRS